MVVLSGNPRPGSRTLDAATRLAQRVPADVRQVLDLAHLAGHLHDPGHARIGEALATVRSAEVLVVATPVYKASFTGLLKSFLDLLPTGSLAGAPVVPVVVSASAGHLLLADLHLRTVLRELGATLPTPAVLLEEAHLPTLDLVLDEWGERHLPVLQTARAVRQPARGSQRPG
ncbi:FMN reductase [Micromonospora pallida]|uniref:FMN reductase n=1 Tax=Micromonospora pallida TaxID=145854 RepID=A0A1C6SC32_9ACTN|nr:FMN reductase [Micromonospora pallida]